MDVRNRRRSENSNNRHPRQAQENSGARSQFRGRTTIEPELRELPQGSKIQWRFTKGFLESPQADRTAVVVDAVALANKIGFPIEQRMVFQHWEAHTQKAIEAYRQTQTENHEHSRKHAAYAALWVAAVRCGEVRDVTDVEAANRSTIDTRTQAARARAQPGDARENDGAGRPAAEPKRVEHREQSPTLSTAANVLERARPNVSDRGKELLLEIALAQHVDAQLTPRAAATAFADQRERMRSQPPEAGTVQKMLSLAALSLVQPHNEVVREVRSMTPETVERVRIEAATRVESLANTPAERNALEAVYVESSLRQVLFPSDENRYKVQVAAMAISEHAARGSGVSTDWEQLADDLRA